jgi:hypothetical protein
VPAKRRRHRGSMRLLESELRAAMGLARPAATAFPDCVPVEPGMPSPPWHQSHYPGKAHLLRHAAAEGQLVFVRCTRCRRRAVYLATDLVTMLSPERDALLPPFPCSRCHTTDYVQVECRVHFSDEVGHLAIRRPSVVRRTVWRTVKLGDP